MRMIGHVNDFVYENAPIIKIRNTSRGFIIKDDKIALIHVVGEDDFGKRDHYETPGGGVEDEDFVACLRREIIEELGYEIENIEEVGIVSNNYYLINRCDVAHYFVARATNYVGNHYTEMEKILFKEVVWIPIKDINHFYQEKNPQNVGLIIHKRDQMALEVLLKNIW